MSKVIVDKKVDLVCCKKKTVQQSDIVTFICFECGYKYLVKCDGYSQGADKGAYKTNCTNLRSDSKKNVNE